jgi:hypothetical protein
MYELDRSETRKTIDLLKDEDPLEKAKNLDPNEVPNQDCVACYEVNTSKEAMQVL